MSEISAHTSQFDRFWSLYPRKTVKKMARLAWSKAIMGADPETIIDGLIHYAFSSERQYQPHPATWLNQERWQYETDTAPVCVQHDRYDTGATRMVRDLRLDLLTPLDELYPHGATIEDRPTASRFLGHATGAIDLWGQDTPDAGADRSLRIETGD
jgi:hypothetical protein